MKLELLKAFKNKLASGYVLGPFCKTTDPAMIETLGYVGMDFVILDLEHGPGDNADLGGLIRAAEAAACFPIVRVGDRSAIGRALDQGALGVQVPHISSAAEAEATVRAARFAPEGTRGVCRYVRAAAYGQTDRFAYFKQANEALVILQIEGREGLDQLDAILEVPGFDLIFVGVYDLSQSLGLTGQVEHERVQEALRSVAARCAAKGMAVGTFVEDAETAGRMARLGLRYLCYSVDVSLLALAGSQAVQSVREASS